MAKVLWRWCVYFLPGLKDINNYRNTKQAGCHDDIPACWRLAIPLVFLQIHVAFILQSDIFCF